VQPLLEVLERCITHPDTACEEEAQLFCYALYLLAKWRETRAYPLVIRWLSLSDAASTRLSGDVSTQDGARILAAVCDGDLEPIKQLVLNRDADEYSRGVAVAALASLAVWAEVRRETILDYFGWLAREGLERQRTYVWARLPQRVRISKPSPSFPIFVERTTRDSSIPKSLDARSSTRSKRLLGETFSSG
jgi:uncharacterized protein DUF1186